MEILTDYMPWIIAAVLLILLFIFLATHRKTALPNEVLIISGALISGKHSFRDVNGNRVKLITNGGSFILPILQRWDVLSLNTRTIEVATPEVYTQQGVPIIVNGTCLLSQILSLTEKGSTSPCVLRLSEFIACACSFTEKVERGGQGRSVRQEMKELVKELKKRNPDVEKSIFKSIHNVQLDTLPEYKSGGVKHTFLEKFRGPENSNGGI